MEIILDILNLSLPVSLMFFGAVFTLLGVGADLRGIKIRKNSWRTASLIVGIPTLLYGIISTSLLVFRIVFDTSLKPPEFSNPWIIFKSVGFIGLVSLIVFWIIHIIRERSYKLDTAPVIDGKNRNWEANIQVRNTGKREISCHALLEKVVLNGKVIDVNTLNPQGYHLSWDRKDQTLVADYAVLAVGIPRIVYLLSSDGKDVYFEFQHARKSQAIEYGTYSILVGIYRRKGRNFVRFDEFVGTLHISLAEYGYDVKLEWIDEPKTKSRFNFPLGLLLS